MVKPTLLFVFGVLAITLVAGVIGTIGYNLAGAHDSPRVPPAQQVNAPAYPTDGR